MTPSFDKNGKILAPEPTRHVSRGVTFTYGLAAYSSIKFFSSHGMDCPESKADETSALLVRDAYEDVVRDVQAYKDRMEGIAQEVLAQHPDNAAPAKKVEENPFTVSARPTAPVEQVVTVDQNGKVDIAPAKQEAKIQPGFSSEAPVKETKLDPAQELLAEVVGSNMVPVEATARGRKPAAAKPGPEPPPEPVKPAAQANPEVDDSDIPANMGGTHVDEPGPDLKQRGKDFVNGQETQIPAGGPHPAPSAAPSTGPQLVPALDPGERVNAAVARIAAETKKDPAKVKDGAKEFFRAFLNIKGPLPKLTDEVYKFAIPVFESLSFKYAGNVAADPASMGLEAGVGWNKLIRHTEKWPEPLKRAAMRVAIKSYPDNGFDILEFLEKSAKMGNLDGELLIFLQVFRASGAATAMALKETATERGQTMALIMEGLDLETVAEGQILSRISGAAPAQAAAPAGDLWSE